MSSKNESLDLVTNLENYSLLRSIVCNVLSCTFKYSVKDVLLYD